MKHGKNPSKKQKIFIKSWGLNPENWLVTVDAPDRMELVHRHNDSLRKTIHKEVKKHDQL